GNDGDEIGGTGLRFAPRPGLQTVGCIGNADEFSIGDGEPVGRDGENRFRGEAVIRVVVGGQVVARVLRFALRPNLFGAMGIVLVGKDEVEALGGLAFVLDLDGEFFAGFGGFGKRDAELVFGGLKSGRGFVQGDALDLEAGGIEGNAFGVAENGERVGDVSDDLFLFQVKAQNDAGVLQVIILAARERLIGVQKRCCAKQSEEKAQYCDETCLLARSADDSVFHSTVSLVQENTHTNGMRATAAAAAPWPTDSIEGAVQNCNFLARRWGASNATAVDGSGSGLRGVQLIRSGQLGSLFVRRQSIQTKPTGRLLPDR